MSDPVFIAPVTPGILDAGVYYHVPILCRNASYVYAAGLAIAGFAASSLSLGAPTDDPVDRALGLKLACTDVFTDANRTYAVTFDASVRGGDMASTTQTIVVKKWTADGRSMTISSGTFVLASHGLAVGDRVSIDDGGTLFAYPVTVATVADSGHFTAVTTAPGGATGNAAAGLSSPCTLVAKQAGRSQHDITSAATASVAHGSSFTYTISDDIGDSPVVGATGLPAGLAVSGSNITGTPTEYGYFPVKLTCGAMQRHLALTVTPSGGDPLLVVPATGSFGIPGARSTEVLDANTIGLEAS